MDRRLSARGDSAILERWRGPRRTSVRTLGNTHAVVYSFRPRATRGSRPCSRSVSSMSSRPPALTPHPRSRRDDRRHRCEDAPRRRRRRPFQRLLEHREVGRHGRHVIAPGPGGPHRAIPRHAEERRLEAERRPCGYIRGARVVQRPGSSTHVRTAVSFGETPVSGEDPSDRSAVPVCLSLLAHEPPATRNATCRSSST